MLAAGMRGETPRSEEAHVAVLNRSGEAGVRLAGPGRLILTIAGAGRRNFRSGERMLVNHAMCGLIAILAMNPIAHARHCDLNGESVNPDNGSTTAGKTGLMRCFRDDGSLWYEKELQAGVFLGLDRFHNEDGSLRERYVNAQGNTEGRARRWWPGGQLREEGEYRNADAIGVHQSWHRNGALQSLRVHPPTGGPATLTMEWDDGGRLRELRCAPHSVVQQDREACGHAGRTTTTLYHASGRVRERRQIEAGKLLRSERLGPQGERVSAVEFTAKGRIETQFHPNGEPALRDRIEDGFRVLREQWYMNGALKQRVRAEAKDRDPAIISEFFRDDGSLQERLSERGRRAERREHFDAQGRITEDWEYSPEGHAQRHRKYTPDGRVVLDEELYPDGSRRVLQVEAEIGG